MPLQRRILKNIQEMGVEDHHPKTIFLKFEIACNKKFRPHQVIQRVLTYPFDYLNDYMFETHLGYESGTRLVLLMKNRGRKSHACFPLSCTEIENKYMVLSNTLH
jgi:hypothetical protein